MNAFQVVCLNLAFFGFALATLTFMVMAPWYRSISGTILVLVKVCLTLILLVVWLRYNWPDATRSARLLIVTFLYPLTAMTGFALTWVIARAQYSGVRKRALDQELFSKHDSIPASWDGVERRRPTETQE